MYVSFAPGVSQPRRIVANIRAGQLRMTTSDVAVSWPRDVLRFVHAAYSGPSSASTSLLYTVKAPSPEVEAYVPSGSWPKPVSPPGVDQLRALLFLLMTLLPPAMNSPLAPAVRPAVVIPVRLPRLPVRFVCHRS